MIFTGAKDINPIPSRDTWQFQMEADEHNKAKGYYISTSYKLSPDIEAIARYDQYNRMTNISAKKRVFKNTTLGLSYKLKGMSRIDFNYTLSKGDAPHNDTAESILDNFGNTARIQLTWVYK